jgi:hypothetical protein
VLVLVIGGPNSIGACAERQAKTPTDGACMTMLTYHESATCDDEASAARDRLRYVESRLDKAAAAEAVAIREYLTYDCQYRGAGRTPNELVIEPVDIGLATQTGTGHRLFMRAAQACTDLGHPELQEYLYEDTRDEDYASH